MSIFALIKNNEVVNLIESEPDFTDALRFMFQDADDLVEVTEDKGLAYIGGEYLDGKFKPVKPYASWIFNEPAWAWEAPKPKPEGLYVWDEAVVDWVEFTPLIEETPAE
jgi:hypothetical protein